MGLDADICVILLRCPNNDLLGLGSVGVEGKEIGWCLLSGGGLGGGEKEKDWGKLVWAVFVLILGSEGGAVKEPGRVHALRVLLIDPG